MLVGSRIWIIREPANNIDGFVEGGEKGLVVKAFRNFFPVGAYQHPDGYVAERKHPLIQLVTDPPGIRTLAVGSIRLSRPY